MCNYAPVRSENFSTQRTQMCRRLVFPGSKVLVNGQIRLVKLTLRGGSGLRCLRLALTYWNELLPKYFISPAGLKPHSIPGITFLNYHLIFRFVFQLA